MTTYKGINLHQGSNGAPITLYAQQLPEAGAWAGEWYVGTMPDRASAKLYVDWLHQIGPEHAKDKALTQDHPETGYIATSSLLTASPRPQPYTP